MGIWRENAAPLLLGAGLLASAAGGAGWYLLLRPDPAISACEWRTRESLKTPSTYRRISAAIDGDSVTLKYDAQNIYGAVLRETAFCQFRLDYGSWYFSDDDSGAAVECVRAAERSSTDASRCQADVEKYFLLSLDLRAAGIQYPLQPSSTKLSAN